MSDVVLQVPMLPGGPEWIVILLIAVLLFGANKIPKLARSTGQAMGEFQKGRQEVEEELQDITEGPDADAELGSSSESEASLETESTADSDSTSGDSTGSDSSTGESTSTESA